MDDVFINPVSIPDIINSLFFWKEVYADKNPFSDALEESIAALLPLNDLLIEVTEQIDIREGTNNEYHKVDSGTSNRQIPCGPESGN